MTTQSKQAGSEHTPGPWVAHQGIDADKPTVWDVTSRHDWTDCGATPEGWFVATVHEVSSKESAEADARLIASAPDLLAALEAIDLARTTDEAKHWKRATEMSDAAIAKARGVQP